MELELQLGLLANSTQDLLETFDDVANGIEDVKVAGQLAKLAADIYDVERQVRIMALDAAEAHNAS